VPAGRLVYFHNHGDPGPGIYLPAGWSATRASFHERGHTLPGPEAVHDLEALEPEGFYRVAEPFNCCAKKCRSFEEEALVQLGYDAEATPILFTPELVGGQLAIPERGTRIDRERVEMLRRLRIPVSKAHEAVH